MPFMSMKDEKNGQIGMWKYWLSVAVASFLAISAFLVTHIKELENWLIIISCLVLVALFVSVVVSTLRINKYIRDLRDL